MGTQTKWNMHSGYNGNTYLVHLEDEKGIILYNLPHTFHVRGEATLVFESLNELWGNYIDSQENQTLESIERIVDNYLTKRADEINRKSEITSGLAGMLFVRAVMNDIVATEDCPDINVTVANINEDILIKMIAALLATTIRIKDYSTCEMQEFIGEIISELGQHCSNEEAVTSENVQVENYTPHKILLPNPAKREEMNVRECLKEIEDIKNELEGMMDQIKKDEAAAAQDGMCIPWEIETEDGTVYAGKTYEELIEFLKQWIDKEDA